MFSDTLDVLNYLQASVDANLVALGLTKTYADFNSVNQASMPCAVFEPNRKQKERHDIGGGFRRNFQINIYVCHAKLTVNSQARSKEDMALVQSVEVFLELDKRLGGNLVDSFVTEAQYGSVSTPKLGYIKGTRLTWEGFSVG